jgi:hypothetical protein
MTSSIHTTELAFSPIKKRGSMVIAIEALDQKRRAYKAAVDQWIAAIRHEEELASVEHSVADLDAWEAACLTETDLRAKAKQAKQEYEDELREKFFNLEASAFPNEFPGKPRPRRPPAPISFRNIRFIDIHSHPPRRPLK